MLPHDIWLKGRAETLEPRILRRVQQGAILQIVGAGRDVDDPLLLQIHAGN